MIEFKRSRASIEDGYKTLFELGAVDENRELTELGKKLGKLPLDPRYGKMLLSAEKEGVVNEILVIASALAILDPRERPREKQEAADLKHEPFLDESSDFLSYLKLWEFWRDLKLKLSNSRLRKACRENFLSFNRMREWSDVYVQLRQLARELKIEIASKRDDYNAIHRAILSGLLYAVASKSETGSEYKATNAGKFLVWPGSGVKKKSEWIVGAERVETNRSYLRTVAKIDPAWIEELGAHVIVKTRRDPFWDRASGRVRAYEKTTLYGLTIAPRRVVNYGTIDPEKAREIFINDALAQRDYDCDLPFFKNNEEKWNEAELLRDKLRKHDLQRSLEAIYEFYDERLPRDVYDDVTLKRWYKRARENQRKRLFATLNDFCRLDDLDDSVEESFPDAFQLNASTQFPLEYTYSPGDDDDGVTLVTPAEGLRQLDARKLGWLVPGLLEQKVLALLRTLPKEIRRELVPVPDAAREITKTLQFGKGSLEETLAREVSRRSGKLTTPDDFDASKLPSELRFNIKVVDEQGATLAEGRDASTLREQLGAELNKSISEESDPKWKRDDVTSWDFGSLPDSVPITRGGVTISAFPCLCDPRFLNDESVASPRGKTAASLRLFDVKDKALRHGYFGALRLFTLLNWRDLKGQARYIPNVDKWRVYAKTTPFADFDAAFAETIAARALDLNLLDLPKDEGDFNRLTKIGRERIPLAVQDVTSWTTRFLESLFEARVALEKYRAAATKSLCADVETQIQRLLPPLFYLLVPWERLKEYPRYFKAITLRFEKWSNGGAKTDERYASELAEYWSRYESARERLDASGLISPELETYRWAIEEYRVSLFAQRLGVAIKTSPTRLEKMWEKIIL